MPRRPLLFAIVLATVSASSVLPTTTSVATTGTELCFGQVPTIVGTPGSFGDSPIAGTVGVDVVVTNGAYGVDLLGGDDLLCITGAPLSIYDEHPPYFNAGDGNDRIDSSQHDAALGTALISAGAGADEVIGGPLSEFVSAADTSPSDPDADVIDLAGGGDGASVGTNDVVRMDSGQVALETGLAGGVVEVGPGWGSLSVRIHHHGEQAWKVDNRVGRLTRDGQLVTAFTGYFRVFTARARGDFVFIGSDDDEVLTMNANSGWTPLDTAVKVRMQGGNDRVNLWRSGGQGARFDGGDGVDRFDYSPNFYAQNKSVVFNMTSGLLKDTWPDGQTTTRRAMYFEKAMVGSNGQWPNPGPITLKGTSGPNWLKLWGPGSTTIYGKAGDDEMIGWGKDGALIGGRGHDSAQGGYGVTRCDAEVTLDCRTP